METLLNLVSKHYGLICLNYMVITSMQASLDYCVKRSPASNPKLFHELFSYPSGENSRLNTPPVGSEFACS